MQRKSEILYVDIKIIIVESEKLHHDIGLTLDDLDLVQLFTSILHENQTTISIETAEPIPISDIAKPC